MASLIPALSNKAKEEISKKIDWFDKPDLVQYEHAFQDLFDLEKHPMTWEQLFEYIKKLKSYRLEINKDHAIITFYEDGDSYKKYLTERNDINESLHCLVALFASIKVTHMILIGDIHGWWEKPQTYDIK